MSAASRLEGMWGGCPGSACSLDRPSQPTLAPIMHESSVTGAILEADVEEQGHALLHAKQVSPPTYHKCAP